MCHRVQKHLLTCNTTKSEKRRLEKDEDRHRKSAPIVDTSSNEIVQLERRPTREPINLNETDSNAGSAKSSGISKNEPRRSNTGSMSKASSLDKCSAGGRRFSSKRKEDRKVTKKEARETFGKLMEIVISKGYPFQIFDPIVEEDSNETAFLRELRPDFVRNYLPTTYLSGGVYLDQMYECILNQTKESIKDALEMGYGTLVFDGWEDKNRSSVVNKLLKTESSGFRKKNFLPQKFVHRIQIHDHHGVPKRCGTSHERDCIGCGVFTWNNMLRS